MVAVDEVETGGAISLLKKATGGSPISTRSHHQETYEFAPQFTLWIIANDRPRVPHDDTGLHRRLREIPFVTKFENPDPSVRRTLTDPTIAGPAILAWAVKGCLIWQKYGVARLPDQVEAATAAFFEEMDPLADWLADNCVLEVGAWTTFKSLREDYLEWAKRNGIRNKLGSKKMGQVLAQHATEKRSNTARGYSGIKLASYGVTL